MSFFGATVSINPAKDADTLPHAVQRAMQRFDCPDPVTAESWLIDATTAPQFTMVANHNEHIYVLATRHCRLLVQPEIITQVPSLVIHTVIYGTMFDEHYQQEKRRQRYWYKQLIYMNSIHLCLGLYTMLPYCVSRGATINDVPMRYELQKKAPAPTTCVHCLAGYQRWLHTMSLKGQR